MAQTNQAKLLYSDVFYFFILFFTWILCCLMNASWNHGQVEEYGDEVFQKLSDGAHIYFCGLKGMMPGILQMLEGVAEKKKIDWDGFLKDLKHKGKFLFLISFRRRFFTAASS